MWDLKYRSPGNKEYFEGLEEEDPKSLPDAYFQRPDLSGFEQQILTDFMFLADFRPTGAFAEAKIPFLDMIIFCRLKEIEDPIYHCTMWRILDQAMIQYYRDQQELESKLTGKS